MTGMRVFSSGELDSLRATQQGSMMDTCQILTAVETQNAYGEVERSWSVSATVACGYDPLTNLHRGSSREVERADSTVLETDADIRLPEDTAVSADDRIKVTHRQGTAEASPLTFEIISPIKKGPSGILVNVRNVDL